MECCLWLIRPFHWGSNGLGCGRRLKSASHHPPRWLLAQASASLLDSRVDNQQAGIR